MDVSVHRPGPLVARNWLSNVAGVDGFSPAGTAAEARQYWCLRAVNVILHDIAKLRLSRGHLLGREAMSHVTDQLLPNGYEWARKAVTTLRAQTSYKA